LDVQDEIYRATVLPPSAKAQVSVEADIAQPWCRFVDDAGETISIEHFGASTNHKTPFREFTFTIGGRRGRPSQFRQGQPRQDSQQLSLS
jgi:transketolase